VDTKNLLGLCVAGATLASSAVMFSANPAQAISLTYNWSFSGLANTSGTFVADNSETTLYSTLSSISGTIDGFEITSLVSSYWGNDNHIPLDGGGISFSTTNGAYWNLFLFNGGPTSQVITGVTSDNGANGIFTYSEAQAVPWETDAFSVIGSIILFAGGLWAKTKFSKLLEK